jgi:hypothetical protein
MQILSELAPDEQLLELLYAAEVTSFRGSARELKQKLCNHHLVGKEATRLLDWHANCGNVSSATREEAAEAFHVSPFQTGDGMVD